MLDWYTEQFSLKGKSRQEKRSALLKHSVLLSIAYLLILAGVKYLLGEPVILGIIFAAILTVVDLLCLAIVDV